MIGVFESFLFRHRTPIIWFLIFFTLAMGVSATRLEVKTDPDAYLPANHEFVQTYRAHLATDIDARELAIEVRFAEHGVLSPQGLKALAEVDRIIRSLRGIDSRSMVSVLAAVDVPYLSDPESLALLDLLKLRDRLRQMGMWGHLVSDDGKSALIRVLVDPVGKNSDADYYALAYTLERGLRDRYARQGVEIRIAGYPKRMGDVASAAQTALPYFLIALGMTILLIFIFAQSLSLTLLAVACSMVSVVWQFGFLSLMGFSFDPTALLVPFVVYTIGVSHGVQQINLIARAVCWGEKPQAAARASFRRLFVPGVLALITTLAAFLTLALVPVTIIQQMGITAAVGILLKIVSNLIMLPLLASYVKYGEHYVERMNRAQELRLAVMRWLAQIVRPRHAFMTLGVAAVFVTIAGFEAQDRRVGVRDVPAPELKAAAQYNQDAKILKERFGFSPGVFTTYVDTPPGGCRSEAAWKASERFFNGIDDSRGVASIASLPIVMENGGLTSITKSQAVREVTSSPNRLVSTPVGVIRLGALAPANCASLPMLISTEDQSGETLKTVAQTARSVAALGPGEAAKETTMPLKYSVGGGTLGLQAAMNEVVSKWEFPALLAIFGAIVFIVAAAYRDWKAVLCCAAPLVIVTLCGLWLIAEFDVGITISTLPVLVLSVGIGVDYAFYFYNRLHVHLANRYDMVDAFSQAMEEAGSAVIVTGMTLALGVAVWAFSILEFQATMGLMLSFMFVVNTVAAITVLPSLAVALDWFFPRRSVMRLTV